MSCDWNIRCVDCNETHYFGDANHQDELMWLIIKHGAAIAELAPLLVGEEDIKLMTPYGLIDAQWFAEHHPSSHTLVPIDEYGGLATQCIEYVACACGNTRRCVLDLNHAGDHCAVPAPRSKP